jgi:hypothetical protein
MNFKGIQPGAKVTFQRYNGLQLVHGAVVSTWKKTTAKVNPILIFSTHVVVNHGNNGQVVDENNYISHKP